VGVLDGVMVVNYKSASRQYRWRDIAGRSVESKGGSE